MSKTITFEDVIAAVSEMSLEDTKRLNDAIRARWDAIHAERGAANRAAFQQGDEVQLVNIKPKYLNGIRGIITRRHGDKFVIELQEARRRYFAGAQLTVPASCVEGR